MRRNRWIATIPLVLVTFASVRGQSLSIVDDRPGSFIDISASGQPLNLADDQELFITTTLGNLVFPAGNALVSNNGGVGFGIGTKLPLEPLNEPIPSANAFEGGQSTLAFWDDIDDKDGDVFYLPLADRIIFQWHNRLIGSNPLTTVRFQIQIFDENAPDGLLAQYVYDDIEGAGAQGGLGATIGYQDGGAGFGDFQWSFNAANAVANGTVLSLVIPEPATLMLLATAGLLAARRR